MRTVSDLAESIANSKGIDRQNISDLKAVVKAFLCIESRPCPVNLDYITSEALLEKDNTSLSAAFCLYGIITENTEHRFDMFQHNGKYSEVQLIVEGSSFYGEHDFDVSKALTSAVVYYLSTLIKVNL